MNPQQLHDAISLLPEDLLTSVDQLRRKKPAPLRSMVAVAACFCLVIGLWFLLPSTGLTAKDSVAESANGNAAAPEMTPDEEKYSYSGSTCPWVMEVLRVEESSVVVCAVLADGSAEDPAYPTNEVTITFENLEQIPSLQEGQQLRIYFWENQFDQATNTLHPYKIELIEEKES